MVLVSLTSIIPHIVLFILIVFHFAKGLGVNYDVVKPDSQESTFLYYSFRISQIFGTIAVVIVSCVTLALLGILLDHFKKQRELNERRSRVLRILKGIPFGRLIFQEGLDCPICLMTFEKEDQVVQLQCHNLHVFHQSCIKDSVEHGKPICPLCRVAIGSEQ
ncbi:hypothetical protein FGO68_gene2974 [Halteria grandinella]|uniref:RING-type domain-containing protein n=1 Tax=Halteria grandinella TaxID=5974 RepID=A0A8J8NE16_HALGN|nr:hypothetical protein FGO68_gene6143 [Halteria grandinella]TNV73059.1 hypothetical protein FGO68_gene2974 [Halteria grandinella]